MRHDSSRSPQILTRMSLRIYPLGRAKADVLRGKATDIALIPEADGAEFIKPTDGAQEAFKGWSTAKAQDGILSSPFMALAALLAILNHFNKETVGPQDYDLTTYRPKKKEW